MTTLLYDPYFMTLGGGERYMFDLAIELARTDDILFAAPEFPAEAALASREFEPLPRERIEIEEFSRATREFPRIVLLTNEIPLPTHCRRSFAVVQFPFVVPHGWRHPRSRLGELARIHQYSYLVYSDFVNHWLARRWHRRGLVVPPRIKMGRYDPDAKQNLILSVGRFFVGQHSKRQDALIDAFLKLSPRVRADWRLVLVGGVKPNPVDQRFVQDLVDRSMGAPIEVLVNASAARLRELYAVASIYWHGAGVGRSADQPECAEHFGMTTAEAMSWGAVPIAYADGGQTEIVTRGAGFLWHNEEELRAHTEAVIADPELRLTTAKAAVRASARYDGREFSRRVSAAFVERP